MTNEDFGEVPVTVRGEQNGMEPVKQTSNAVAQTDQQRAVAEVHAQLMIARMNPRDPVQSLDRILNACCRPTLAAKALYTYARGGTDITGPSIRLAEVISQNWPNIQSGWRELEQRPGMSIVQAYAWDMETNYRREITFNVQHVRYSKSKGNTHLTDPRDIYENNANQAARRMRACILAVIPGDITEAATDQCEKTLKSTADCSPEAMQKMLDAFEEIGVSKAQIEKRIQRRIEAIQPAQVISLRKIFTSLRDGMSSVNDWFEKTSSTTAQPQSQTVASNPVPQPHENGNPPPEVPQPTLTFEQREQCDRIILILNTLYKDNMKARVGALMLWSDQKVSTVTDTADLKGLVSFPDIIPQVLERAEITLGEANEKQVAANMKSEKKGSGKLL